MAKAKKPRPMLTRAEFGELTLTYKCGDNEYSVRPSIDYEGGCNCRLYDSGDYCYCPPVNIVATVNDCPCGNYHKFDIYR